jgi:DNA-binding Lrp family transcriptional regulator
VGDQAPASEPDCDSSKYGLSAPPQPVQESASELLLQSPVATSVSNPREATEPRTAPLESQVRAALDSFENAVRDRPDVLECYAMTGAWDYLLRVVLPDIEAFEKSLVTNYPRFPESPGYSPASR